MGCLKCTARSCTTPESVATLVLLLYDVRGRLMTSHLSDFRSLCIVFQLLDKPWSQVSSLPPRFLPSTFARIGFTNQQSHCWSNFHRVLLNSRSRAFRKSICAQKRFPRIYSSRLCTRGDSKSRTLLIIHQARG